jgi:hypothetical protein
MKLGELLLKSGRISAAALDHALQAQSLSGGRLGTNLVEMEELTLDQIAAALAEQHRVAAAPAEAFAAATDKVLALVPRELCDRYMVFPLELKRGALRLAMRDPRHPEHLDALSFTVGMRIEPLVAPELRMLCFLERRLGIPRTPRYLRLSYKDELVDRTVEADATGLMATERERPDDSGEVIVDPPPWKVTGPQPLPARPRTATGPGMPAITPRATEPGFASLPHGVTGPGFPAIPRSATGPAIPAVAPAAKPPAPWPGTEDEAQDEAPELVMLDQVARDVQTGPAPAPKAPRPAPRPARPPAGASRGIARPVDPASAEHDLPPLPPSEPLPDETYAGKVPPPRAEPAPPTLDPAEVLRRLETARDTETVGRLLLAATAAGTSLAALFDVRDGSAMAHDCLGSPLGPTEIVKFQVSIDSSFLFNEALSEGAMWGTVDEDPVQREIARYMQTDEPGEACVVPVGDPDGVQQLLCLQVEVGGQISEESYNLAVDLCAAATDAYARLCR